MDLFPVAASSRLPPCETISNIFTFPEGTDAALATEARKACWSALLKVSRNAVVRTMTA